MIFLTNSSIIPQNFSGLVEVKTIDIDEAKKLAKDAMSAIGHESTARVLSQLLQLSITPNRIQISAEPGDVIVAFQLLDRLTENKMLSEEELKALKFVFRKLEFN